MNLATTDPGTQISKVTQLWALMRHRLKSFFDFFSQCIDIYVTTNNIS